MPVTKRLGSTLACAMLGLAAGCSDGGSSASNPLEIASRDLVPADGQLAGVYNRSCRNCHTIAATGAPLTGDTNVWEARLAKGMDTLVDSVVNGYGGMPPFGMCMDCDAQQFEDLIAFMAEGR
ncbi:c-type cytochrome [Parahaliea aestuarii]|uniref:Cytochrome c5 family protein n=1 Tax=Parahaliea aestuarii TaxID=1852021 RepID=A0A5C8ZRZ1_9GAMM|nr:c-type cytochrome [Parahaliea aestuarii]TXS90499.1 cytochrome c5 family protein [Parahaliea aestuarii]